MAFCSPKPKPDELHGIVDMGSNGIRFSISSLQPPTERIMPTLYQSRAAISLYDAQYSPQGERVPIGEDTIAAVITAFKHFHRTCQDFHVPSNQITVLATEATRTAVNSEDFRKQIKHHVGWEVKMLPKEEEGRVGAMGISSSLPFVKGLVMDLGGGSTQLSWLIKESHSPDIKMPQSVAVSMPYGAAAMSRHLQEAECTGTVRELRDEVLQTMKLAYAALEVPSELEDHAKANGGFTLYLSGGGFRGWGYILMSKHAISPYPVPVINGFRVTRQDFLDVADVKAAAAETLEDDADLNIFRVSDRRAGQVPAVAFLVGVLAEALPQINEVRFCQGGVREGYLFASLPGDVRAQHPLVVATRPFDITSASDQMAQLLSKSLPQASGTNQVPPVFDLDMLQAFANLMYYHSSHSKDLQATSALRSTTSGILASVHGVLHESRALLALLLCSRWGGDVPPSDEKFKADLERLVDSPLTLWWINYIGAVSSMLADIYPNGAGSDANRVRLTSKFNHDDNDRPVLHLDIHVKEKTDLHTVEAAVLSIEKVGKRKRWVGGKDGAGYKIRAKVRHS